MRIMFISDIHGIKTNLELIRRRYEELNCSKLVVLGDLYYIGPRNILNSGYDISYVKELPSFSDVAETSVEDEGTGTEISPI